MNEKEEKQFLIECECAFETTDRVTLIRGLRKFADNLEHDSREYIEWEEPKHSPEKIVEILHSIDKITINDEVDFWFKDNDKHPESLHGFHYGSFTRCLMELIESYLIDD